MLFQTDNFKEKRITNSRFFLVVLNIFLYVLLLAFLPGNRLKVNLIKLANTVRSMVLRLALFSERSLCLTRLS